MTRSEVAVLAVPGAGIHFEVRGSGPVLLILQGGAGNAGHSARLGELLAARYTVVTYDRRGLSRSRGSGPVTTPTVASHADDAHRLLAAFGDEPAFVLGCSFGALIGLELAARHGEQVHTLVAHEPPVPHLLPEAELSRAVRAHEEVEEVHRRHGVAAAAAKLLGMVGVNRAVDGPTPPVPGAQQIADLEFFLTNDFPQVLHHRPDLGALGSAHVRIVAAVGRESRDLWDHRSTRELARRLGAAVVEFPGGHAGATTEPQEFAATLHEVLQSRPALR